MDVKAKIDEYVEKNLGLDYVKGKGYMGLIITYVVDYDDERVVKYTPEYAGLTRLVGDTVEQLVSEEYEKVVDVYEENNVLVAVGKPREGLNPWREIVVRPVERDELPAKVRELIERLEYEDLIEFQRLIGVVMYEDGNVFREKHKYIALFPF